jgi:hypothetical protein
MRVASILALVLLAGLKASAAEPSARSDIMEIRALYLQIRQAETKGRLRKERRSFAFCRAYEDAERTLYLDRAGAPRSYHVGRGSDDSAVRTAYYYDAAGALRFVFAAAGAVNGTVMEYRVYLSKAGERGREERRMLSGPGYPFPAQLPDDWLVGSPMRAFYANAPLRRGALG